MSCECDNTIIQQVKVVVGIGNLLVQNGLTLGGSTLEWGGSPLLHNTDITGAFILNLGTGASRLTQGNIKASNQVLLDYNSGVVGASLLLASTGFTLTDTTVNPKGLVGASDYSANYTNNTYIQKLYSDTHLGGKSVSSLVTGAGAGQDHFYLQWDNASAKYTLVATGVTIPGADTNVLFNDATALGASAKFTFNKTTGTLVSGDVHILGTIGTAGSAKALQVQGSDTNISLTLQGKGAGDVILALDNGAFLTVGSNAGTDTSKTIRIIGNPSNIDFKLLPKGTGKLIVGDSAGSGNERIIQVDGSAADISGRFKAKGAGSIYLTPGSGGQVVIGDVAVADIDYYLQTIGSGTNRNLRISSNGTGRVIVDGYATKEVSLGNWNMVSTASKIIDLTALGIAVGKFISVQVFIISDDSTVISPIQFAGNGYTISGAAFYLNDGVLATNSIYIERKATGGVNGFDNTSYDTAVFNRGYAIIKYIA